MNETDQGKPNEGGKRSAGEENRKGIALRSGDGIRKRTGGAIRKGSSGTSMSGGIPNTPISGGGHLRSQDPSRIGGNGRPNGRGRPGSQKQSQANDKLTVTGKPSDGTKLRSLESTRADGKLAGTSKSSFERKPRSNDPNRNGGNPAGTIKPGNGGISRSHDASLANGNHIRTEKPNDAKKSRSQEMSLADGTHTGKGKAINGTKSRSHEASLAGGTITGNGKQIEGTKRRKNGSSRVDGKLAGSNKPVGGQASRSVKSSRPGAPVTARSAALDVLTQVDKQGAYSNLLLGQILQRSGLARADAALATELVYGTIQRLNTIDYFLGPFVRSGLAKLEPWVRALLRLSYYQLVYLERVPDHAAVSEAVNLAKRRGHAGIAGMVNGTLRTVIRERAKLAVPDGLPPAEALALRQSHPAWLVARWIDRFGLETAERICAANNEAPHTSVRVNALRFTREALLQDLLQHGVDAAPSALAPQGLVLRGAGSPANLPWFADGALSIQDESSMLVAELLDPQPGERVLDCCAAPGGKTTHIAEKMRDEGVVWASDVHEHKRGLIIEQAKRLDLQSVRTMTADARELADRFEPASFDRILLDAPCSGFGVIRRKPDLKWAKKPEDVAAINAIQRDILERVHPLLKPGGILVYSTCTIEREENEATVERFLQEHPEFDLDTDIAVPLPDRLTPFRGMITILPHDFGSDGFFIARMRKRNR